ncbi:MAG: PH domain-containing protein [Thermoguttaceae bacterium]|nr:PH domain-containing protein [Thermoguttaceae bacterium]
MENMVKTIESNNLKSDAAAQSEDNPKITWKGGCYSGKAFRVHFVLLVLLTCLVYYLGMKYGSGLYKKLGFTWFWLTVQGVPLLLWLRYCVKYFYYTWTISYELRSDCLISRKGFFRRTQDTLALLRINDVKMEQTLWDTLFYGGIGTVVIYSTDPSDPELHLSCLEHPKQAFETLTYMYTDLIKRRGIKTLGGVSGAEGGMGEDAFGSF